MATRGRSWRAWRELVAQDRLLVLDGAIGSELADTPQVDWTSDWTGLPAQLYLPDLIKAVHTSYVNAGADMITTNTCCANRHVMGDMCDPELQPGSAGDLVRRSNFRAVEIAREVVSAAGRPVVVAGSMSNQPPHYTESTICNCCSNPTLMATWPSAEEEIANYREQARILLEAGVDIILLEMVKDRLHGSMLVTAASEVGLPLIIGLTLKSSWGQVVARDEDTFSLQEIVESWRHLPNVVGFAVMHCPAFETENMVAALRECWQGFIACYPNRQRDIHSLTLPDALVSYDSICPLEYASMARRWRQAGANLIGGCCGVGPAHIQAVAALAKPELSNKGGHGSRQCHTEE